MLKTGSHVSLKQELARKKEEEERQRAMQAQEDTGVIKQVDNMLNKAVSMNATEIHMEQKETKTQVQVKDIRIKASSELWARFEEWMRVQSCQTLAEGFRAVMRQVTNFDDQSQQKIA